MNDKDLWEKYGSKNVRSKRADRSDGFKGVVVGVCDGIICVKLERFSGHNSFRTQNCKYRDDSINRKDDCWNLLSEDLILIEDEKFIQI